MVEDNRRPENKDLEMLTVKEVTKMLKISTATLYKYMAKGTIPVYKFGRATRFKGSDIQKFIEECKSEFPEKK